MSSKIPQLLIDELTERKILTPELTAQISDEAAAQEMDFGQVLVQKNIITDADLVNVKAEIYKLPIIAATNVEIDPKLSEKISDATINFYKILPFARQGGLLKVVLLDP